MHNILIIICLDFEVLVDHLITTYFTIIAIIYELTNTTFTNVITRSIITWLLSMEA